MLTAQPTDRPLDIHQIHLRLSPAIEMTEDQFFRFCQINKDLRIERTAKGDLIIMPPAGWETGRRNAGLTMELGVWAKRDGTGVVGDSSTGFKLPNGATRSPDAAWVRKSRLANVPPDQKKKFLPLCPDFVVELRSETDRLTDLQEKMQEYIDNGAQLGWLIDPQERRVYIYRPEHEVESLENPSSVSGEPELPGFVLALQEIWESL